VIPTLLLTIETGAGSRADIKGVTSDQDGELGHNHWVALIDARGNNAARANSARFEEACRRASLALKFLVGHKHALRGLERNALWVAANAAQEQTMHCLCHASNA
jgi:hypothetical protein